MRKLPTISANLAFSCGSKGKTSHNSPVKTPISTLNSPAASVNLTFKQKLVTIWATCGARYKFPPAEPKLFSTDAHIYYLKLSPVSNKSNLPVLYKLGYTTTSIEYRVSTMGVAAAYEVSLLALCYYNKAAFAYAVEQLVHERYARSRWRGWRVLANGNSEVYSRDIMGLDG